MFPWSSGSVLKLVFSLCIGPCILAMVADNGTYGFAVITAVGEKVAAVRSAEGA